MTKQQLLDLLERAGWTFVQSFTGVVSVAVLIYATQVGEWATGGGVGDFPPLNTVGLAAVAGAASGIAAVVSLVKGFIAQRFGNGTAATLPARDEPILSGPDLDEDEFLRLIGGEPDNLDPHGDRDL